MEGGICRNVKRSRGYRNVFTTKSAKDTKKALILLNSDAELRAFWFLRGKKHSELVQPVAGFSPVPSGIFAPFANPHQPGISSQPDTY